MSIKKRHFIPSAFTFFNLFLGFLSIVRTIEGDLHFAAWLIILSALCDALDGKVARWTGFESRFGFELDSLSDVISFGIAPAVLVYVGVFQKFGFFGFPIVFLFVFSGVYRLARFNVHNANEDKHIYMGLTIPIAAITLASFWLFENTLGQEFGLPEWSALLVVLAMLMMSTLPYRWPRLVFDEGRWRTVLSIGILLAVLLMAVWPEKSLFPMLCLFVLVGIVHWTVSIIRGETEWAEFFMLIKRNE
ncbi:MAG TPA: CDP-diacylglycerol--serine O-phosphatidyltransferase [bacterium]